MRESMDGHILLLSHQVAMYDSGTFARWLTKKEEAASHETRRKEYAMVLTRS